MINPTATASGPTVYNRLNACSVCDRVDKCIVSSLRKYREYELLVLSAQDRQAIATSLSHLPSVGNYQPYTWLTLARHLADTGSITANATQR
jgi:hypothetical protein